MFDINELTQYHFFVRREKQAELTKLVFVFIAIIMLIFGLMFISTVTTKPGEKGHIFIAFDDLPKMIYRFLIIFATMSSSITMFTTAASMLRNKILRNILSIFITIINVFLTFTLVPSFIGLTKMAVGKHAMAESRFTAKEMSQYFLNGMGKSGAIAFYVFVITLASVFIFLGIFNCVLVVWQRKVTLKGGIRIVELPKKEVDPFKETPELFA